MTVDRVKSLKIPQKAFKNHIDDIEGRDMILRREYTAWKVSYYFKRPNNSIISMNLNGIGYYYIRIGQEDIIGLHDASGTKVVSYIYDTWGELISINGTLASTVGVKNPYIYRAYRYDT